MPTRMTFEWREASACADRWREQGDGLQERDCRRDAVARALAHAVLVPHAEALSWLAQHGLVSQLERIVEIEAGGAGPSENLFAIDMANVLDRPDLARFMLERSPALRPPLWVEYRKALLALLDGATYRVPAGFSAKGWLASFVPVLALAQSLSLGEDTAGASAAVDAAFARRNADARGFDPCGVDGDGRHPVQWNLRKHSVLAAARSAGSTGGRR